MVSRNDPIETIFNSMQVVKDALLPIELGVRKAARDIESCLVMNESKEMNLGLATELPSCGRNGKLRTNGTKKRNCGSSISGDNVQCLVSEERRKGLSIKIPVKTFLGMFTPNMGNGNGKNEAVKKGMKGKGLEKDDGSCTNCLKFTVTWSLLVNGFVQAFPFPFKTSKKGIQTVGDDENNLLHSRRHGTNSKVSFEIRRQVSSQSAKSTKSEGMGKEGKHLSLDCFIGFVFDLLTENIQKLDQFIQERTQTGSCCPNKAAVSSQVDRPQTFNIWEARKLDVNGFLGNLMFARVGDMSSSIVGLTSPVNESGDDSSVSTSGKEESGFTSPQKLASGILSIPLSNVERLKSTLSTVSLTELIELLPQLGRPSTDHPDKKKLFSVQDFFRYTEAEGRRFFEELDRDGDGQVTLEDLEVAMRRRKLPRRYATEFMRRARSHLFSKSFGWKQFLSLMEQKEPTILRAYTSLCLSKSGTLQKSEILASLKNAGLPANEENAIAMMRFLNADTEGSISYGHFRNFMVLLPYERLQDDPRNIWFEAATVVAVAPPVEIPAGNVLKSALAGGLASALSTSLMHPIDTIKTRVQASTFSFPEVISTLPQIGVRGVYRGSIPAILGQFSSHGLRTGIFEASKLVLINFAPTLPEFQVQSIASFCSTFLGTAVRIPCEVLKQRLQAGIFDNVGEAIVGTWRQDGPKGFFRGTGATLCREVPLYVVGMGLYAESKKMAAQLLGRELEPWETIAVGALSGGLAAVVTTPFDVMKTRLMTAPPGRPVSMTMVAFSILRHEGPLGLFKGAVPRFFWVAPLGAMNFAGYELAKKAMDKNEELGADQLHQKKLANSA